MLLTIDIGVFDSTTGLRPFLSLAPLYERYWLAVDYILLFALFSGVARATIGRRLEGREGQIAAGAVGAILALGGIGLEMRLGLRLSDFGGVALSVLLLVVGVVVFRLVHAAGLGAGSSAAVTVLVLGMGATVVSSAGTLGGVTAVLQIGVIVSLLYLGVHLMSAFGERASAGRLTRLAEQVERAPKFSERLTGEPEAGRSLGKALERERRTVAQELEPITYEEEKDSYRIVQELELIRGVLQREDLNEGDRRDVGAALRRVPPERHQLWAVLERVRKLDRALLRFDLVTCERLRDRTEGLSREQRERLARFIAGERQKIETEKQIDSVERLVLDRDRNSEQYLEAAIRHLTGRQVAEARRAIEAAVRCERQAEQAITEIERVERELLRLTEVEAEETEE
jgi:hypothetical protein